MRITLSIATTCAHLRHPLTHTAGIAPEPLWKRVSAVALLILVSFLTCGIGTVFYLQKAHIKAKKVLAKRVNLQRKAHAPDKDLIVRQHDPKAKEKAAKKIQALFRGHQERKKINKVKKKVQSEIDLPLSPAEFEFLSKRSIGLRFSEKADKEFIHGFYGDAISLSGYPRVQLQVNAGVKAPWLPWSFNGLVFPATPKEGPKLLEERVIEFISKRALNFVHPAGWPGIKTNTLLYIYKQRKADVKMLIGNFTGADHPYEVKTYFTLGKCGKQLQGASNHAGKLIKYFQLQDDFFKQKPLSIKELNSPYNEAILSKLHAAMAHYFWKKVRLQIRLHYQMCQRI